MVASGTFLIKLLSTLQETSCNSLVYMLHHVSHNITHLSPLSALPVTQMSYSSPLPFIVFVFYALCFYAFFPISLHTLPRVHFLPSPCITRIGLTDFSRTHSSAWFLTHNKTQISCFIPLQPPIHNIRLLNKSINFLKFAQ